MTGSVLLWLCLLVGACRSTRPEAVQGPYSLPPQSTPLGTALPFKAAIDSGRTSDALLLFTLADGRPLLAEERYELVPELERLSSQIARLPITGIRTDSLSPALVRVEMELDYWQTLRFTLRRHSSFWVVTGLERIPWNRPAIRIFPQLAE
ncbi:MAG: hypothetical protein NZ960_04370 [Candidatus Kapabacteria bacterium]|nr:hypothetical protein [Candidatus Kapabacteria bacterium]MDW8012113.1 hypothetical protein [Bacteroidota bacterium]